MHILRICASQGAILRRPAWAFCRRCLSDALQTERQAAKQGASSGTTGNFTDDPTDDSQARTSRAAAFISFPLLAAASSSRTSGIRVCQTGDGVALAAASRKCARKAQAWPKSSARLRLG